MSRECSSLKISADLSAAIKYLRQPGREWSAYRSKNACIEDILAYALYFRKLHALRISSLKPESDQDLVHEYIRHCVENDIDDRARLPKPAKAEDVLKLAKEWTMEKLARRGMKSSTKLSAE